MHYDALGRLDRRITPAVHYTADSFVLGTLTWSFPKYRLDDEGATSPPTIPGDTATFAYDVMGNMRSAINRDARVARGYDQTGRMTGDTLHIRTVTGRDSTSHVYAIRYAYDLDGRRAWMKHPVNLVTGLPTTDSLELYTYEAGTGALSTLRDLTGNLYRFQYNAAGQLETLNKPNGEIVVHHYDLDGQLVSRSSNDPMRYDTLEYDPLGKITYGGNIDLNLQTFYTPFGPILQTDGSTGQEFVLADQLGNARTDRHRLHGLDGDIDEMESVDSFTYQPGVGRAVMRTRLQYGTHGWMGDQQMDYDSAGNRRHWLQRDVYGFTTTDTRMLVEYGANYYDADNRLRVSDRQRCNMLIRQGVTPACVAWDRSRRWEPSAFEEYRYDALGRRIWTRTRMPHDQCPGTSFDCEDHTVRTVWDGDQVLWEIRAADLPDQDDAQGTNAGRVGYTHGGLDAPLSMYRVNYLGGQANTLVMHLNWRGLPDWATFPASLGDTVSGTLHISSIDFPAKDYDAYFRTSLASAPTQWFGSIISGSKDASGQFYRRNRYYDANTGQFTQQDPAGLAGGLNAYGFAGGDPVSFSDPYGLWPCPPDDDCPSNYWANRVEKSHSWLARTGNKIMQGLAAFAEADIHLYDRPPPNRSGRELMMVPLGGLSAEEGAAAIEQIPTSELRATHHLCDG